MRMKWKIPGTDHSVIIPASSWSRTNSENIPNVLVSYWESPTDWTSLPALGGLNSLGIPKPTEYVSTIDFDVGEREFLGRQ